MNEKKILKHLSPDEIFQNPENPRIYFRQDELENLMVSIHNIGIQVPVSVYEDEGKYYLLDGERRWRCAKKLNLEKIPALIQEKPSKLDNLLLMYNIHALREQWDFYTIASNVKNDTLSEKLKKMNLLTQCNNARSSIGGLTSYISKYRNMSHHSPKSKKQAYEKIYNNQHGFREGIKQLNHFKEQMKHLGINLKI